MCIRDSPRSGFGIPLATALDVGEDRRGLLIVIPGIEIEVDGLGQDGCLENGIEERGGLEHAGDHALEISASALDAVMARSSLVAVSYTHLTLPTILRV